MNGSQEQIYMELVNHLRHLRHLCASNSASLITLMHADACAAQSGHGTVDEGDERLFRYLLRTADVWVSINELPSGRAAACDGEIGVYALVRPTAATTSSSSEALQPFLLDRYMSASTKHLYRILPDGTGPKQEDGTRALVRVWSRGSGADII